MRNRLAGLILCATALALMPVAAIAAESSAKDAADLYLDGFRAWQEGVKRSTEGAQFQAMAKLKEAEAALVEVQTLYPDWNPEVVNYRLKHIRAKLAELVPPVRPPKPPVPNPLVPTPPAEAKPPMPTIKPPPMYFDRDTVPFEFNGRLYFKSLLSREATDAAVKQR